MRVALAQLRVEPGVPFDNLIRARTLVEQAFGRGADLVVLPEMALPGYLLGDLWERPSFLRETLSAQDELIEMSRSGGAIAFGGLALDHESKGEDGRPRKYIAFYLAQGGKLIAPEGTPLPYSVKTLLPNYREFDDVRHFGDSRRLAVERGLDIKQCIAPHSLNMSGVEWKVGGMLCEDGWSEDYGLSPADILVEKGANLLVNLSSSPFTRDKNAKRDRVFGAQAKRLSVDLLYCNVTGIQNNGKTLFTFDGDSTIYGKDGYRHVEMARFKQGLEVVDLSQLPDPLPQARPSTIEDIRHCITYGTEAFMKQIGQERVVIGASGGVDSAVVAALYAQFLDPQHMLLVNMPSRYNTETTIRGASELAKNLGCLSTSVSIEESVALTSSQLNGLTLLNPKGMPHSSLELSPFVLENIQARDRSGRLLAALAASLGAVFTCNANKSETCVGYSTLYGDHAGYLANIADLWKGEVYDLAEHLNERAQFDQIPRAIIDLKPSAELSEAQNPEKGGGDPFCYPYHDALFRSWVEDWQRRSPEEILEAYLAGALEVDFGLESGLLKLLFPGPREFIADLERWWSCYSTMGVAKRIQAPPVLAVSRRAFGFDHREAQTKLLFTRAYRTLKKKALAKS
jgi:NAD+ synthase (glutamine-hydrolysing)